MKQTESATMLHSFVTPHNTYYVLMQIFLCVIYK
uniref:Uncharacterized protein n=1 Tax=Rhizophora mucronata TaxID=61149 RepID=A0A2P2QHH2_RHIMU